MHFEYQMTFPCLLAGFYCIKYYKVHNSQGLCHFSLIVPIYFHTTLTSVIWILSFSGFIGDCEASFLGGIAHP